MDATDGRLGTRGDDGAYYRRVLTREINEKKAEETLTCVNVSSTTGKFFIAFLFLFHVVTTIFSYVRIPRCCHVINRATNSRHHFTGPLTETTSTRRVSFSRHGTVFLVIR